MLPTPIMRLPRTRFEASFSSLEPPPTEPPDLPPCLVGAASPYATIKTPMMATNTAKDLSSRSFSLSRGTLNA